MRSLLDRLPRPRDGSWPATGSTRPPPRGPADIERFVGEATEEEGWAPVVSRDGFQVSRRNLRGSRHVYVLDLVSGMCTSACTHIHTGTHTCTCTHKHAATNMELK